MLKFNDTTDKQGIIQACESYCELGNAGISGDTDLLKEFVRHSNVTGSKIWSWIFSAYGGAQYDDGNQVNLPAATQDLNAGVFKYAIPSDALTLKAVEIKYTDDVWTTLSPTTEELERDSQSIGEFGSQTGVPSRYLWKGNTIALDVLSDKTVSNGLKLYFDRGSISFTATDTATTPGFASEFHNAIPVGASIEWLKVHKPNSAVLTLLMADWKQYEMDIKKFYAQRYKNMFPPRLLVRDTFRQMQ